APDSDDSHDKGARTRVLELLVRVGGIMYVPDAARAVLYRHAAQLLRSAKDRHYGWSDEATAAKTLAQFGPHVPSIAFDEVYQEILAVWCGNRWGHSQADDSLKDFLLSLN